MMPSLDTLKTSSTLSVNGMSYDYFSLAAAESAGLKGLSQLPFSLKILLENLLRHEDGTTVSIDDIKALTEWLSTRSSDREVAYRPARVLMQDFTGVPAIVDLAAMRDAIQAMGGNAHSINPLSTVDLVIDHSIQVDQSGNKNALDINNQLEMKRNKERYQFLRWGQKAFDHFQVVPPDTGICHQINLEFLAKTIWTKETKGNKLAYPDTVVGTDSHTTMINGLGILGWGVGGIEAEAAMLGQPISMLIPEVVGVKLVGKLREGITATDLVLSITHVLRKKGVVGKFVEFSGPGMVDLPLADRATIANMAPEYGATCGFFPIDQITIDYLRITGRDEQTLALVEAYAKIQGLWNDPQTSDPLFTETVTVDLSMIQPSIAGPKRPQDNVLLSQVIPTLNQFVAESGATPKTTASDESNNLQHGDIVMAAITSCTNTSNPSVLMAAGLVAKKAVEKGLTKKPWVKTSLAPGSQVVTRYLKEAGLQPYLDAIGFSIVGYGCTTCIGNSGPLPENIAETIQEHDLIVSAVLSGNRNFEGRIHPLIKANWLASPPLVVAFSLAGTMQIDLTKDPLGHNQKGEPVYLHDLWPSNAEVAHEVQKIHRSMFSEQYADIFLGKPEWQAISVPSSETYAWESDSTYIQRPPFFDNMPVLPEPIKPIQKARILALLGDSITTDHISPAGSIKQDSPAGQYLLSQGVSIADFNSLGARRGNHHVMMRGTFANNRIKNEMLPGTIGGMTKHIPSGETLSIFDAAMRYQKENTPLCVIAGKEYGTGSSRDWAAKGPKLLGVKAVIAESFERIHRSNLIGMGILPLQFMDGMTRQSFELVGDEMIDVIGLSDAIKPRAPLKIMIHRANGSQTEADVVCRIDTLNEVDYFRHGGILQFVLRGLLHTDV